MRCKSKKKFKCTDPKSVEFFCKVKAGRVKLWIITNFQWIIDLIKPNFAESYPNSLLAEMFPQLFSGLIVLVLGANQRRGMGIFMKCYF